MEQRFAGTYSESELMLIKLSTLSETPAPTLEDVVLRLDGGDLFHSVLRHPRIPKFRPKLDGSQKREGRERDTKCWVKLESGNIGAPISSPLPMAPGCKKSVIQRQVGHPRKGLQNAAVAR